MARLSLKSILPAVILSAFCSHIATAETPGNHCKPLTATGSPCFTIEGRLSLYQGTPSWRISRFGTERILGVLDGSGKESEGPENVIPNAAWLLLRTDPDRLAARGTYTLCPLTAQKTGAMQMVCIEAATHLSQVSLYAK